MKKIMISICIFFAIGQVFGQEVPELFPVSPTAASLYKHSKIPMNLSSGQANQLIPLYTIEQNGFSFPISLRYNYSGLVLDEGPSRTGLGWTLAATGVVNREVRGLPDEGPDGIYGVNSILGSVLEPFFTNNTQISVANLGAMADGQYDTEPDVYHVSVSDMSFSFKVDENGNAFMLSKHNYLVDFSANQIVVTDDNGVKYFFGTNGAQEVSSSLGEFDDQNGNFGNGHEYVSSWFLTQIRVRNSSFINFVYTNKDQVTSYSFMGTSFKNDEFIPDHLPCSDNNWGGSQNYSKTVTDKKILSYISFATGKINFLRTSHDFYELYTGVEVKDNQNNLIYDYDLIYDNEARDLLVEVDKNGEHFFDFEYYNVNFIPDFVTNTIEIPTAMDWWGYYNGKINNTVITSVPGRPNAPDKSPSYRHSLAGALKTITYPTGGESNIYYDQNQILSNNQSSSTGSTVIPTFNRLLHLSMQGDPQNPKLETFSYTFMEDTYAEISHDVQTYVGAYVKLHMQAPGGATYGNYVNHAAQLRAQADQNPNYDITEHPFHANFFADGIGDGVSAGELTWWHGNSGGPIKILAGTYNFTLETWGVSTYGNSSIDLRIKFYKDTDGAGNPNVDEVEYVNIGGLRVREIETCPDVDSSIGCTTRTFEYSDAESFGQGNYSYGTKVRKVCLDEVPNPNDDDNGTGINYVVYNIDRTIYNYRSFTNVNFNSGIPVFYHNVLEGIGKGIVTESVENNYDYVNDLPPNTNDDGSFIVTLANGSRPPHFIALQRVHYMGGYEDNTFESPFIESNLSFPFTPKSKDLSIGRLEKSEIFRYDDTGNPIADYSIIKDNQNTYSQFRDLIDINDITLVPGFPKGLKVARKISFEGGTIPIPQNEIADYFFFEEYGEANNRFLPADQLTTDFTDAGNITYKVSNVYYPNTQKKSVLSTDSRGEILKTENTYLTNLTSPSPAEQLLIGQNRISTPVETRNYLLESDAFNAPSELMGSKKTHYEDFGNDLILPKTILASKGSNPLEERMTYHSYDIKGNPVEMSKINGTRTYVVWGYAKTYPIAIIENASALDFTSAQVNAIDAAVVASNQDIDEVSENQLRDVLSDLRNAFPNAMVQTATYNPLIGVTSKTDVKDYNSFFEYDNQNRLKHVKDDDEYILKSNEYHYKNNN